MEINIEDELLARTMGMNPSTKITGEVVLDWINLSPGFERYLKQNCIESLLFEHLKDDGCQNR